MENLREEGRSFLVGQEEKTDEQVRTSKEKNRKGGNRPEGGVREGAQKRTEQA